MKERVYRVLNIKFSESSQVFDLLTVQFFIGLANALVSIIAFTLFIYNFPISSLPVVYLVVAGLLFLMNFIYEQLEHRFSPLQLLKYVISFSAILLTAMWFGLSFGDKNNFIFALLVSSVLLYMATGYAFWGLVSLLFNVRESRRVFSIVGSGDIPAKLIGYLVGPLLIPFLGLTNLIWLAIFSLICGLVLFSRYIRKTSWDTIKKKHHGHEHHAEKNSSKQDFVSFFFKHKLIFAISLLSILSYNVFVLVDFTFISQVKLRFGNISDLAAYIAIFFALGRLIALVFKLIFTSRVIERLGVIYCLFITPVALFLFCLLFFFYGYHAKYNLFIFGIMAMLTEVLRSTMQEPVFFILFQPLKESLRLKGHMISKGYMYPPSLIIVGLSLLFLYKTGIEITIMLAIKVLLLNLVVWAAVIFFIRRTYLHTVHSSIKKGTFSSDDIYISDQRTTAILLQKIEASEKIEVIYALNLLEKSGFGGFGDLLETQFTSAKDVAVKKYALERMEALGKLGVPLLKKQLAVAQDADLKQKLVSLLLKYDPLFLKEYAKNISSHEYGIRKTLIISLLDQREFTYLFTAGREINSLIRSSIPAERELAVEIISELKNVEFSDAIYALINDKEIGVRRVAISTACKLKMKSLLPDIIGLLNNPADKNIALKGLQQYGDSVFRDMYELPGEFPEKYATDLIKIAGKVKGEHSIAFLLSRMDETITVTKDKIVHALWIKEYTPGTTEENEKFSQLLNSYLKTALDKLNDFNHIPEFIDKELVKRSIFNEVEKDLSVALKLCCLLYRKKEINRILELMEMEKHDKLYNAMEMLELLLPKKISKDLNSLFDFILDPSYNHTGNAKQEVKIFFDKVIFNAPLLFNSWTKAVCVYSSWRNNETIFLQKLKAQPQTDDDFLVKETKDYVMESIK